MRELDTCPHCDRDWHGLAITERIEEMRREYQAMAQDREDEGGEIEYADSAILGDYRYADDDSPVICPGSTFIGPRLPRPHERPRSLHASLTAALHYFESRYVIDGDDLLRAGATQPPSVRWWRCENPNNALVWEVTSETTRDPGWLGYDFGPTSFSSTLTVRHGEGAPPICVIDLRTDPEGGNCIRIERPDLESAPTAIEIYATSPPPVITGTWLDRDGNPPRPWGRLEPGRVVAFETPDGEIHTGVVTGDPVVHADGGELSVQMHPYGHGGWRALGALRGIGLLDEPSEADQ
ncbi:hypothetical protein L5I01_17420 [Gordonia sp. HY442]|uniref:hypothetical protein n=1 Tax=Gordonia zhenghanii TaxID=2911516 RepID=UPI001F2C0563|nr:hypothetical protein [Gordonia zhenghanii]MCF8605137.1 hypothetical protein [Gordonia zhenghanii]